MANPAVTYTFVNGNVADASQVNQNFTDIVSSLTDGTKSLNIDALTCGGTANLNGSNNIGNAAGDVHTVTGRISGNGTSPAGQIAAFAMATPPTGWLLCDGSAVSRTTYADLFSAISTTWDTCRNQSTGSNYAAPAGTDFRVPDLRGVFLRSVGTSSGYSATSLSSTQDDATAKNGLTASTSSSAGTSAVSGSVGGSDGTHTHLAYGAGTGASDRIMTTQTNGNIGTAVQTVSGTIGASGSGHGHSFSLTAAAQSITSTTTIGAGDAETRPVNVGIHYFIKI